VPAAAKGKPAVWQPRTADELNHLSALAEASIGFDKARGDMVTVQDLAFDANHSAQPAAIPGQVIAVAENSPVLVKYLALLAGVLAVLAFGVRPALKRARPPEPERPKELPEGAPAPPALRPPEPAEGETERARNQEIFEQVTGHLKREPAQTSRLLQSWIHTETQ
jgi:flagellar M-ring protein FliF